MKSLNESSREIVDVAYELRAPYSRPCLAGLSPDYDVIPCWDRVRRPEVWAYLGLLRLLAFCVTGSHIKRGRIEEDLLTTVGSGVHLIYKVGKLII